MSNYRKKSYNRQQKEKQNRLVIPLMMLPFVSLLVRMYQYDITIDDKPWISSGKQIDIFLHCKMVAIISIAVIMLGILAYRIFTRPKSIFGGFKKQDWIQWAPFFLFFVFSFLSTLFSEYSYWGWHGIFEMYESVFAILSYGVIAIYAYLIVEKKEQLMRCIFAIMISAGLIGLIGTFQAFGLDFFSTGLGKIIMCGSADAEIQRTVGERTTYSTLYNPNYVGVYACLIIPLLFSFMLGVKKIWIRVITVITMLLVLYSMYGSGSKAGFLVMGGIAFVFVIFYRKSIMKYKRISIGIIVCSILLACILIGTRGDSLIASVKEAISITKAEPHKISNIITDSDGIHVTYDGNTVTLSYEITDSTVELWFVDEENHVLDSSMSEENFFILDERFADISGTISFEENGYCVLTLYMDDCEYHFTKDKENGTYAYLTSNGKLDYLDGAEIPRARFFDGLDQMASGRGYIWSRTLPLVKQYILFGVGADSFMFIFPHNDYIGRTYNYYESQIMTKPHSIYLQVATQDGLIAMIGMLVGWLIYLVRSIRNIWKEDIDTVEKHLMVGICVSVIGYMIMGLTNDSTITVAPVFWMLLGCGMALNRMIEKQNREEK